MTPLLEKFQVRFFCQSDVSIPHLQHFINTTEKFRFNCATLKFDDWLISAGAHPCGHKAGMEPPLQISVDNRIFVLEPQVATMASLEEFLYALRTVFSNVEALTLEFEMGTTSSQWQDDFDRTRWRGLFGSFSNVKTLKLPKELVWVLSNSLQVLDGESPTDLFPELREILYPADMSAVDAFSSFSYARQSMGHPVTLVHH
jgi:hypothetical protein